MSRGGTRAGSAFAAALLALLLAAGLGEGSSAAFTATAGNQMSRYAFTSLGAPSSLSVSTAGRDVTLSWGAGANGSGYSVVGAAGTSSTCSGAGYSAVGSTSGTTFTDAGRWTPQGTWFCYEVRTTFASWTSVAGNPSGAAQLGVVASSVALANGGSSGRLDPGDTITVTFNQPIQTTTGPVATNTVCAISGATIVLGATALTGSCAAGETRNLGTLTGGSSNRSARFAATYAWSNGNRVLTVTIGALVNGSNTPNVSGSWTFNPVTTATKLLSAAGSFHACDTNAGGGNCLPAVSGSL